MLNYIKVELEDIKELFEAYVASLSDVYDDFLETHILDSFFYKIEYNEIVIGYFAIHNGNLLTQFYIEKDYLHLGQGCFKSILEQYKMAHAFVPTCDELLLSLSMDFHKKIELQAYFFVDTNREVEPPKYSKSMLRLANLSDVENIKRLSGDFFSELYQNVSDRKIYILEEDEIYGFGIIENNRIHKECRGIGMFTVEAHRQKGVGRSIILHLKDLCKTLEYQPLPGCWYHNYNSKRTLESCGFASKTRLLKVEF
jgi:GNAT superfamily N-acetyltransferase